MPTINVSPVAANDDGAARSDNSAAAFTSAQTANNIPVGTTSAAAHYRSYVRFPGVNVPQGATVSAASVEFTAAFSDTSTTVNIDINAGAVDDASQPANSAAVNSATLTSATVAWDGIAAWTANSKYSTPDLASIIQEVVNRSGWVSGNAIILYFDSDRGSFSAYRRPASWDHASLDPPLLSITYSVTQQVETSLITSTATVYSPGVTPGAVSVAMQAIASTLTLYQPAASPGAVTVSLPHLISTLQMYAPIVDGGQQPGQQIWVIGTSLAISVNGSVVTLEVNGAVPDPLTISGTTADLNVTGSESTINVSGSIT